MARNAPSQPTPVPAAGDAAARDPETLLNDWLEWQADLMATSLGQIVTIQQGLWSAWIGQMSALMQPWPAAAGGAQANAQPQPMAALADWWTPLWQRGAEQLA